MAVREILREEWITMLYLIAPELSGIDAHEATGFIETVGDAIGEHQGYSMLANANQLRDSRASVTTGDGVAVFAANDLTQVNEAVASFLERASSNDAAIVPIAIDPAHRVLPEPICHLTLFSAYDWLHKRELPKANLAAVAPLYAWHLLAASRPTFANADMTVFLSYGRQATEDLASKIDSALGTRGNLTVRDNKSMHGGEVVRSAIDEALEKCDVLVLLDSDAAQDSEWVEWELLTAAARGIPIVWVDCGAPPRDPDRHFIPGPSADIYVDMANLDQEDLADQIDRLVRDKLLGAVPDAQGFIAQLDKWGDRAGAKITDVDTRRGIYVLTYPTGSAPYPTRERRHVVQVFARRPHPVDHESLVRWLRDKGYLIEDGRTFDAAIMASAAPGEQLRPEDEYCVNEPTGRYLENLKTEGSTPTTKVTGQPGLLMFGALPNGPVATDQVVRAARNVTATWLRLGGEVVFGGHPTITWHVIHAAEEAVGRESSRERVHLYQSEHWTKRPGYWTEQPRMDEIAELATVVVVPAVDNDEDLSLESMRQQMIQQTGAVAAVAIGGRTDENGTHSPGVIAEAAMARAATIPVFALGATGGATASLTAENANDVSGELNDASHEDNSWLSITEDYSGAAVRIWSLTVTRSGGKDD